MYHQLFFRFNKLKRLAKHKKTLKTVDHCHEHFQNSPSRVQDNQSGRCVLRRLEITRLVHNLLIDKHHDFIHNLQAIQRKRIFETSLIF